MKTETGGVHPNKVKLFACLGAVYIIWGSTFLGMKIATEKVPPFLISGLRFMLAGSILLIVGQLREKIWPTARQLRAAILVGALLIGIGNSAVALAVRYMPSGLVALIVAALPAWFVGLDWAFFSKKRPATLTLLGILVGFVGLFFLFNPFSQDTVRDYPLWPIIIVVAGSVSWAFGSLLVQRLPMPTQITSTAIQMLSGAAVSLLLSAIFEQQWASIFEMTPVTLSAYFYLVFLGSLVGFTSYSWLAKNAPTRLTATYAYVNPVVALFLGWLVANENLTLHAVIASGIVVAGVVLMTMGKQTGLQNEQI